MANDYGGYWSLMFTGKYLWYNLLNLAIAITMMITMITQQWLIGGILMFTEWFGIMWWLQKKDNAFMKKHQGESYIETSTILRGDYREDMVYCVEDHHELQTMDSKGDPIELSEHYMDCEAIILSEYYEDFKHQMENLEYIEDPKQKEMIKRKIETAFNRNRTRIEHLQEESITKQQKYIQEQERLKKMKDQKKKKLEEIENKINKNKPEEIENKTKSIKQEGKPNGKKKTTRKKSSAKSTN